MKAYLSKNPYEVPPFNEMLRVGAFVPGITEASYQRWVDALRALRGLDVSDIAYDSDGLRITGIEVLPKLKPDEKLPLVIYNRGGSGNFGMLNPFQIVATMAPFAQRMRAGVLASNYRGNGGSEGKEEWGGGDVRDVLRLIEIGKQQPWWDGKNMFMIGWSRGCMMNYLALKHGAQVNAVASVAGESNLFRGGEHRPDMEIRVYARFITGYAEDRETVLKERSAEFWPEKIAVPLLLLHGDADDRVQVEESRRLHHALEGLGKEVKYIEYPGGDHGLWDYRSQSMDEMVNWFEAHRDRAVEKIV